MKIKNTTLVGVEIQPASTEFVVKKNPTNYIALLDRSGSMSWTIGEVIDDLSKQLDNFDENGTISVGWFSGENQFDWICKGVSLKLKDKIKEMLSRYRSTVGMTCFSQILVDTKKVIADLSAISDNFSLYMMTDGEPTVWDRNKEVRTIKETLKELSSKLGFSLFVGYGEYYNRELLLQMTSAAGGVLVHSANLKHLSSIMVSFAQNTVESQKIEVEIPNSTIRNLAFIIEGKNVIAYEIEDGKIAVPKGTSQVYYLTADKVKNGQKFDDGILYAAAKLYSQAGDVSTAIDLVATVGDVNFIDGLNNSFTNAEYGKVEEMLGFAAVDKNYRLVKGKNLQYLPKDDAYCLLDLLDDLQAGEAEFLPFSKDFVYTKISKGSKTKEGYPKLEWDKSQTVGLGSFVWNKTKLNLSLKARMNGTVDLGTDAKSHGLAQSYPTHAYRNYALIKDGKLNVQKLPLKVSKLQKRLLEEHDLISVDNGNEVVVDLTKIPVINRSIAKNYISAATICDKALREAQIEVFLKYLRYQLELLTDKKVKATEVLSEEQVAFLESKGIGKDGYNPPSDSMPSVDSYTTKEFDVSPDNIKSIPKITDFLEKLMGKGIDTKKEVYNLLFEIHTDFENSTVDLKEKATIAWIEDKIDAFKTELKEIRAYLQKAKFAVLLAKQNFLEIPKLEEKTKFTHNGVDFTFSLKNVEVKI